MKNPFWIQWIKSHLRKVTWTAKINEKRYKSFSSHNFSAWHILLPTGLSSKFAKKNVVYLLASSGMVNFDMISLGSRITCLPGTLTWCPRDLHCRDLPQTGLSAAWTFSSWNLLLSGLVVEAQQARAGTQIHCSRDLPRWWGWD